MRKARLGGRRIDTASPPPRHLQPREILRDIAAAEREFYAPIPSCEVTAHRKPCP